MNDRILILGGNKLQLPLIEASHKEGYFVILVDYTTTNPGILLADKHYQVDFRDKKAVLEIAKKEAVQGVISNSDAAMPIVAYVSEKMGLVGNSEESILNLSSKEKFRKMQDKSGIYAPRYAVTTTFTEALEAVKELAFPIIIKPCDSCGSRGTTKINTYEEFESSYDEWLMCSLYSLNEKVVIEEFVEMPDLEHIIDGDVFVCNGRYFWDGLFTSKRSQNAPMIPMTQTYPVILDDERLYEVKSTVAQLFHEIGISHGEYNIEMYYTSQNKLFCIEINARQGGNGIPMMIQKHCGVDMYKMLVTTVMGDYAYFESVLSFANPHKYICRQCVYSHVDGTYHELYISDAIKPLVIGVEEIRHCGDSVLACTMASDVIAYVDLKFNIREQQIKFSERVENEIYPIVAVEPIVADGDFSISKLETFLLANDNAFSPPLSESVAKQGMSMSEYSRKLCTKGTIVYELDQGK